MANPVGSIAAVQDVNSTTQPSASKPAANRPKATPRDSVNISAAGRAASQASQPTKSGDVDHDGDSKSALNATTATGGLEPAASALSGQFR